MLRSITEQPYTNSALLAAVNEALSSVDGFEPTNNLSVLQGMLKHYPNVVDTLYSSAGATLDPRWMASVWSLCGIDSTTVATHIVGLKDSAPVVSGILRHSERSDLPSELCTLLAKRGDFVSTAALLSTNVISRDDFIKGLQNHSRPALFAIKMHSIGAIDDFELLSTVRRNIDVNQLSLVLQSINPKEAVLNWAAQRFRAAENSGKHLLSIAVRSPRLCSWAVNELVANGNVKEAFQVFRIGQGYVPSVSDLKTIKRMQDALDLATLESLVISESNVDTAIQLVDLGFSDPSLSARVIYEAGLVNASISNSDERALTSDELYETLFKVKLSDGESAGISFENKEGIKTQPKLYVNQQESSETPLVQSRLSPD